MFCRMTESVLLDACRTLFGQDVNLSREFLYGLQPSGAKLAYRTQVKRNHPDHFNDSPQHIRQQQAERFRRIHAAYHLIKGFLDEKYRRRFVPPRPTPPPWPPGHYASSKTPSPSRSNKGNRTQCTTIPAIQLEFGMYAYYLGKITYQQLIDALIWQRRQRPALGVIARQRGWLSEARVNGILDHRGYAMRFGNKAVELGFLDLGQVQELLAYQQSLQDRLGSYFVGQGLLTEEEADRISVELASHNSRALKRYPGAGFTRPR